MRLAGLAVVVCLSLCACGSDGSGPGRLEVDDIVGTWTISLESRAGQCQGAAAGGDLTLWIDDEGAAQQQGIINFVNKWGFEPTVIGDLTGHVDLETGEVDARVWKGVLANGAELVGTIGSDRIFRGLLNDPYPGYGAIFVLGSCSFPATGRKTGSAQHP